MASPVAEVDLKTQVPEVDTTTQISEVDTTTQTSEADTTTQVPEVDIAAPAPTLASEVVRIGVTSVIRNAEGKFLVGKRKGSHGAGTWQFPGGHLEKGEDLLECGERETLEETNLVVKGKGVITITNDVFEEEKKHYITVFVMCDMTDPDAVPEVMEPNKCSIWLFMSWEELKAINESESEHLFLPVVNLMKERPNFPEFLASLGL